MLTSLPNQRPSVAIPHAPARARGLPGGRRLLRVSGLLPVLLLAAACGQKGPLSLPEARQASPAAAASAPAAPAAPASR